MSYSGDPANSVLDAVRFLIADTDVAHERLTDAEITYTIDTLSDTWSDPLMYAAFCADRIADLYAGEVSISADGVSISTEQLQDKYRAMAAALRAEYALLHSVGAEVYAGGVLRGDHRSDAVRRLNFSIGLDDNDRAGHQRGRDGGWIDEDGRCWP